MLKHTKVGKGDVIVVLMRQRTAKKPGSGVEVMLPTGKWISLEEEMFGSDWEPKVKDLIIGSMPKKLRHPNLSCSRTSLYET